jgi:hypothetical protein
MKNLTFAVALLAIFLTACNNNSDKSNETQTRSIEATQSKTPATTQNKKGTAPLKEIVSSYLQIKNGLATDDGKDAASGGKAFVEAIGNVDKTKFTAEQNKTYTDIADE